MKSELQTKSATSFHPIVNPDEITQYKHALSLALHSTNSLLSSRANKFPGTGWLCLSVWRMAVLGSNDDRLSNGHSLIKEDLNHWDDWLQNKCSDDIQMLSVPLLESSVGKYSSTMAELTNGKNGWIFKRIQLAPRQFDALQDIVDLVSSDMSASHTLWVYRNGLPRYIAFHHQEHDTAYSLSRQLENIINQHE